MQIHQEKTRLVCFCRPPRKGEDRAEPEAFDFLGFTHDWGRSRKGFWVIQRKRQRKRLNRALKMVAQWCRANRHLHVKAQQQRPALKLMGHYCYYGIRGNYRSLAHYHYQVERLWGKWLNRRSRNQPMPWDKFQSLLQRYSLPLPRIVHSV